MKGDKSRALFTEEDLKQAVKDIRSGKFTYGQAKKRFGISKTTLFRYTKGPRQVQKKSMGINQRLSKEEEKELVSYMNYMDEHLHLPFTYSILATYAHQMIRKKNPHASLPNHRWCYKFVKRHNLSARKARTTETSRSVAAASPESLISYFQMLEQELVKLTIDTDDDVSRRVWNMDEKGWSKQQALQQPVLVKRGKKMAQNRRIFSADHITSVHCCNAAGEVLDGTMIIFKKRLPTQLASLHLPPKWLYTSTDSGFMNSEEMLVWLRDIFIPNIGKSRPQLLILDSATCHVSLPMIKLAKESNISVLTLPGKTTSFLQPMDQIFSALLSKFTEVAYQCSMVKIDFLVRPANFPTVLHQAMSLAWKKEIVSSSFKVTGTYPCSIGEISKSGHLTEKVKSRIESFLNGDDATQHHVPDIERENETVPMEETDEPNEPECRECHRPVGKPCLPCLSIYRKRTNILYKNGIINDLHLDLLEPPEIPAAKSKNRLVPSKHLTGEVIINELIEKENKRKNIIEQDDLPEITKPRRVRKNKSVEKVTSLHEVDTSDEVINLEDEENDDGSNFLMKISEPSTSRSKRSIRKMNYAKMNSGAEIRFELHKGKNEACKRKLNTVSPEVCVSCKIGEEEGEELLGIQWIGCDVCPKWWHYHCLPSVSQTLADLSFVDSKVIFRCPHCPLARLCVVCMVEGASDMANCGLCANSYHYDCLPEQQYLEYKVHMDNNCSAWYCSNCQIES